MMKMGTLGKSTALSNMDFRTDLKTDLKVDLRTGSRTIPANSQIAVSKTMRLTGVLISAVFRL